MKHQVFILLACQVVSYVVTSVVIFPNVILRNLPQKIPKYFAAPTTDDGDYDVDDETESPHRRTATTSTQSVMDDDDEAAGDDGDSSCIEMNAIRLNTASLEGRSPSSLLTSVVKKGRSEYHPSHSCARWLYGREVLDSSLRCVSVLFSITFSSGLMILFVLLLELLEMMHADVRVLMVRIELWTLVAMVQLILPSALVGLFAASLVLDWRSGRRWLGLFLSICIATLCAWLPLWLGEFFADQSASIYFLENLRREPRFSSVFSPEKLAIYITRLGLAGVFIVSPLAGYGAVDFPYKRFFMPKGLAVTAEQLKLSRDQLSLIRKTIELRRWELGVAVRDSAGELDAAGGLVSLDGDAIERTKLIHGLRHEISALQNLRDELSVDLEKKFELFHGSGGEPCASLAWPMTAACLFKMGLACYNLWFHRTRRLDPVSAISQFIMGAKTPPQWTAYASFLLMGVLVGICIKGVLENMGRALKRLRQRRIATASLVLVTYLMGLFFMAYTLLLRNLMPTRFQRIILAAAGEQRKELFSITLLNDAVFVASATATVFAFVGSGLLRRRARLMRRERKMLGS